MKSFILFFSILSFSQNICIFAPDSKQIRRSTLNTGISRKNLDLAIQKVFSIYSEIIKNDFDAELRIFNSWENDQVNAFASRTVENGKSIFQVQFLGGLARHEDNTMDSTYAILCHEIGHHIGGSPRKKMHQLVRIWASNEGQSDYWASLKCLRRVFKDDDNFKIMNEREKSLAALNLSHIKIAKEECYKNFKSKKNQSLCYRSAMAGLSTAKLLQNISFNRKIIPKFDTPSEKIAKRTKHNHPKPQCRLDTYFAGALCDVDYNIVVDKDDPNIGTCSRSNGDAIGVRPLCWFNPGSNNSGASW